MELSQSAELLRSIIQAFCTVAKWDQNRHPIDMEPGQVGSIQPW